MVLKSVLNGDRIPICRTDDLEVTLVNPDFSAHVKLPIGDNNWRSLPEIRAAEVQCMQLSLALLARHESEMYVTIETEKNTSNYLQSNSNNDKREVNSRRSSEALKKHIEECQQLFERQLSASKSQNNGHRQTSSITVRSSLTDEKKSSKPLASKSTRSLPLSHPASDKLYRDDEKRASQEYPRSDRQVSEQKEKAKQLRPTTIRHKTKISTPSPLISPRNPKANII